ncbi:MAG: imidazole glycerol phosphate synthase subunit HisH [Sphingomicrobium sp.]
MTDIVQSETKVCVLDYGSGNLKSVFNLFSALGETVVSNDPSAMQDATHIVLPGVGAFGSAMRRIRELIPMEALTEQVFGAGKPFLGVCVGMQVLANKGHEFGEFDGLGWIPGFVDRLDTAGLPLPHIGWNDLALLGAHPLLAGLGEAPDFYYVHSYAFHPTDPDTVLATTSFGNEFAAAIAKDNVMGVQFHPEKSQRAGIRLARNFLEIGRNVA